MKRIALILAVAVTVIMSSCVKPENPTDEPSQISFSILGDSYSTFEGYVDPETNDVWEHYEDIGVTNVEQMWWHKVAVNMDWVLDKNNSFSGALICNYQDFEGGNHYAPNSFVRRMNSLGNSNVIFILGGTNDVWQDAPFGDYVDVDWTEEQLCSFRPALAYLLSNMKRLYPTSKLYFLLETDPCPGGITEETRLNLIESVHRITSSYDVECIDLTIHKNWWHPDAQGQADIARQVLEVLLADFNV